MKTEQGNKLYQFTEDKLRSFVKYIFTEAQKGGGYSKETEDFFINSSPDLSLYLKEEDWPPISDCIDADAPYEDMSEEFKKGFDFCLGMVKHFENKVGKKSLHTEEDYVASQVQPSAPVATLACTSSNSTQQNAADYYGLEKPTTDTEIYLHGLLEDVWHKWQSDKRIATAYMKALSKLGYDTYNKVSQFLNSTTTDERSTVGNSIEQGEVLTEKQIWFIECAVEARNAVLPLRPDVLEDSLFKESYGISQKQMNDEIDDLLFKVRNGSTVGNSDEQSGKMLYDVEYVEGLKRLLRVAGCPEFGIEHPNILNGKVPDTDEHRAWVENVIKQSKNQSL